MYITIIGISFEAGDDKYYFTVESNFPSANEWNNRSEIPSFDTKMEAFIKNHIHIYKEHNNIKDKTLPGSVHFAPHFIVKE